MSRPGTLAWFAHHEARLAWRDWLAMMTAGRRRRVRTVAIALIVFVTFMHFVAYSMVGRFADRALDAGKATLVAITGSLLLSWSLMLSQAMESVTRAFYSRFDLDLILSSPATAQKVFAVRIATMALSIALMSALLAAPFINILAALGGPRWLCAYGVVAAMGLAAAACAVALTVALFKAIGPKRTRLVAQIVAAIIGAAFVIGLQIGAIVSYGNLSRTDVLASGTFVAHAPDVGSLVYWPALAASATRTRCRVLISGLLRSASRSSVLRALRPPCDRGLECHGERQARGAALGLQAPLRGANAAAEGMDASYPRPLAGVADTDANSLPAAAGIPAVAQLRRRHRRAARAGAGPGHGGRTACRRAGLARDFGRGRAGSRRHRAGACKPDRAREDRSGDGWHRDRIPALHRGARDSLTLPRDRLRHRGYRRGGTATQIQLWFRAQAKRTHFAAGRSSRMATPAEAFSADHLGRHGGAGRGRTCLPRRPALAGRHPDRAWLLARIR